MDHDNPPKKCPQALLHNLLENALPLFSKSIVCSMESGDISGKSGTDAAVLLVGRLHTTRATYVQTRNIELEHTRHRKKNCVLQWRVDYRAEPT